MLKATRPLLAGICITAGIGTMCPFLLQSGMADVPIAALPRPGLSAEPPSISWLRSHTGITATSRTGTVSESRNAASIATSTDHDQDVKTAAATDQDTNSAASAAPDAGGDQARKKHRHVRHRRRKHGHGTKKLRHRRQRKFSTHRPTVIPSGLPSAGHEASSAADDAVPPVPVAIDINHAPAAAWQQLPGVDAALAARIVRVRESGGGFDDADDLLDVAGVSPALLQRLTPYLRGS